MGDDKVGVEEPGKISDIRLEFLLLTWSEWMRLGRREVAMGYPIKAAGIAEPGISSFDDFEYVSDAWYGKAVDSIVQGLPEKERAAINFKYLGSRYMFDSEGYSYVDVVENALRLVQEAVERKGIW